MYMKKERYILILNQSKNIQCTFCLINLKIKKIKVKLNK